MSRFWEDPDVETGGTGEEGEVVIATPSDTDAGLGSGDYNDPE